MKNYFAILGLLPGARADEIRQAYRKLAKQYHPDVNKSPDAHERFCEITEAFEYLINHWPLFAGKELNHEDIERRNKEYQETPVYEQFRKEAQERAKRQARMRYDKFRKQHEAFQESGINDIALLLSIFMRVLSVPLFLFLFFAPLVLSMVAHWSWIFALIFMWPFALGIAWYYNDHRKNYFHPGQFYYSFRRIRHLYTDTHNTTLVCCYSRGKVANSNPYKLDLFKLKDIKLGSGGFRQHSVNYISENHSVLVPRSQKAFIIHSLSMLVKLVSLIASIGFMNINSMVWRAISGIVLGGLLVRLILFLSATKSNITYLYSTGLIIRVILWITAVASVSRFYLHPFNISTTDSIHFVLVAILIFDSLLMQIISLLLGNRSSFPLVNQCSEITEKFKQGYIVYNDIPVISFLYPLFRWFFA
jgi:hypothetical protein